MLDCSCVTQPSLWNVLFGSSFSLDCLKDSEKIVFWTKFCIFSPLQYHLFATNLQKRTYEIGVVLNLMASEESEVKTLPYLPLYLCLGRRGVSAVGIVSRFSGGLLRANLTMDYREGEASAVWMKVNALAFPSCARGQEGCYQVTDHNWSQETEAGYQCKQIMDGGETGT